MLIAFEGPDEVGKTSLASALTERLRHAGFLADYVALPGHVIGTLGHHVYELHHNPAGFGLCDLDPTSIQLLHVASHIDQLNRMIVPLLRRGGIVVLDRYWWSAPVYAAVCGVQTAIVTAITNLERAVWRETPASVVFLVRRALPLTQHVSPETFIRLSELYDAFAAAESNETVIAIPNEGDLQSAIEAVERAVRPLLPPSPRTHLIGGFERKM